MDVKSIVAAFCFLIIIMSVLSIIPYQQEDGGVKTISVLEFLVAIILIAVCVSYLLVFFTKKQWYPM